jgi:HemY protein
MIPTVIPLVRAPDDPGVTDGGEDEFSDRSDRATAQAGGFRGFLQRWVG